MLFCVIALRHYVTKLYIRAIVFLYVGRKGILCKKIEGATVNQIKNQRWGSGSRADEAGAREKLVQAAQACYEEKGIDKTRIQDIAQQAKVTRRTVYRYFANQQEVLLAVFAYVIDDYWQDVLEHCKPYKHFPDTVVEALVFSIHYALNAPRHQYMFTNQAQAITNNAYTQASTFVQATVAGLQRLHLQSEGKASPDTEKLMMLAEWYNRIILSFVGNPSPNYNSEQRLRALLEAMLKPAL